MKLGLLILTVALVAPLLWAMSSGIPAPGSFGHFFGVSNAVWLSLVYMALFVALCGLILRFDRPEAGE